MINNDYYFKFAFHSNVFQMSILIIIINNLLTMYKYVYICIKRLMSNIGKCAHYPDNVYITILLHYVIV